MAKLIECFRVERMYNGGTDVMCECMSYRIAEAALYYYGASDVPGCMYRIAKYFKVVDDEE